MQENNTTQNNTTSGDENMSDITSLAQQVQQFSSSYDWWASASQWFIGFTALATILYFVASYKALRSASELNDAQAVLNKAKDEQLATNLKDKDVQIGETTKKAGEANERAEKAKRDAEKANEGIANANLEITKANNEAIRIEAEAKEKIAKLNAEAEKAREGIAIAKDNAAQANNEAAKLSLIVQQESLKRLEAERALLELQNRLSPRILTPEQRTRLLEILATQPPSKIELNFVTNNVESEDFARQIGDVLKQSGWTVQINGAIGFTTKGIVIMLSEQKNFSASALQQGLNAIGFPAPAELNPTLAKGELLSFVGVKP